MYVANLLKTEVRLSCRNVEGCVSDFKSPHLTFSQRQMFVCDTDGEEKADASPPHCAICLETFKYGDEISSSHHCEHFHHHGCIFPWLLEHDDCPVCRRSLTAAS